MRPQLIISLDGLGNSYLCQVEGDKRPAVKFFFDGSIHSFSQSIFPWFSLVGHTNADALGAEELNVFFAAVLNAPVGMMNQPFFSLL